MLLDVKDSKIIIRKDLVTKKIKIVARSFYILLNNYQVYTLLLRTR